jgi:hypothetical protein
MSQTPEIKQACGKGFKQSEGKREARLVWVFGPRGISYCRKREGGIGKYTMINNVCLGKTWLFDSIRTDFFRECCFGGRVLKDGFPIKPVFTIGLLSSRQIFCGYVTHRFIFEMTVNG